MSFPSPLSLLLRPRRTWEILRGRDERWWRIVFGYALPLCLIPAVGWPVGQYLSGVLRPGALPGAFALTVFFSLASVILLGTGFYVLSRFFGARRNWDRAIMLAAYASTPMLAFGAVLFVPMLVVAVFAPLAYALLLCDMGAETLLECAAADSAGFVAAAMAFTVVTSMVIGALCGAAGLI